jgi:putative FmdB family regulatory protein
LPTYQYACTECGHAFEQVQSFSDDALTVCPECQGRLRKLFNAVGVVFKGSGFYRTDSRAKETSGASSSNGSSSNGSSSSDSSSSSSSTSGSSGSTSSSGDSSSSGSSGSSSTKSPQPAAS